MFYTVRPVKLNLSGVFNFVGGIPVSKNDKIENDRKSYASTVWIFFAIVVDTAGTLFYT